MGPVAHTDQHEFASPEWLEATCRTIERWLADVDLTGVTYTSGEQFTNVPSRLNPQGAPTVGWTLFVRDGAVSAVTDPPPPDADTDIVADWDAVEPLAHLVADDSPEGLARRAELAAALHASGHVRRVVRREPPAVLAEAFGPAFLKAVHAFTGPRLD